jgi:hypothetical protein
VSVTAPPRPPRPPRADDVDALIEQARRRARRRRSGIAAGLLSIVFAGVAVYFGHARGSERQLTHSAPAPPSASATTLRLHLVGFGTAVPTASSAGPCLQGVTEIRILTAAQLQVGTARVCVLTIEKLDQPGWGVRRIVQNVIERDSLPAGTIVSRQTQTIWFARDQKHTTAIFRGTITGGSGRYADARGTVAGGGRGVDGIADWIMTLHLR